MADSTSKHGLAQSLGEGQDDPSPRVRCRIRQQQKNPREIGTALFLGLPQTTKGRSPHKCNLRKGYSNNVNNKPKTDLEERSLLYGMRNITRKPSKESHTPTKPNSYCRALSTRMDPEQLKIMNNEDYKNDRFAEALSLYDAGIFLDPEKASYRSNKSATLTSLGRLLEAIFEAREAIKIEPSYERAHNCLATLYLRLGDPDQTTRHYKQAGSEADSGLIIKAKKLQVHLRRCNEAKKLKDWNRLIKETMLAIFAGADSALQIKSVSQMDSPEVATLSMADLMYGDEARSLGDSMVSKSFKNKAALLTRAGVVV
ncbi:inactive TPR repeat-containing thioredoxin TTL3-like protein [Tanacetum coccineum]